MKCNGEEVRQVPFRRIRYSIYGPAIVFGWPPGARTRTPRLLPSLREQLAAERKRNIPYRPTARFETIFDQFILADQALLKIEHLHLRPAAARLSGGWSRS